MAGLVFRSGNGKNMTYSGSRYVNPSHGTRKLCIRTGTGPNDIIRYGLTSNSSASQYCGIRMRVDGKVAYIGCAGSFTTVGTHVQSSVTSYESGPGVTASWTSSERTAQSYTVGDAITSNVSFNTTVPGGTYMAHVATTYGYVTTYAKNTTFSGHATTIVAQTSSSGQTITYVQRTSTLTAVSYSVATRYATRTSWGPIQERTFVVTTYYPGGTYHYSTYTASHTMTMSDNINM